MYGAERATLDLALALQGREGVRVKVFLIEETRLNLARSDLREAFEARDIPVESMPVRHAFSWKLIHVLRAALRRDAVDVLHTVGYKADLHGGIAARLGKVVPVVGTVHGWLFRRDFKERCYARINLWALRRFSRVVVLSRYYERYMKDQGVPSRVLMHIPSGYPAPSAVEPKASSEPFTVGMMGRLSGEKNHAMFLQVAKELRRRRVPVRFVIAGDGPDRDRIRKHVEAEKLAAVEMRGYMPMPDFFQEIHVLAMCSHMENLPYSLLEAMAFGVPVVATRVGGIPDLVEDGVNGYLVEPNDASGMADRIRELSADDRLLNRMAQAGAEKLGREFSVERHLDDHVRMYQELIGE